LALKGKGLPIELEETQEGRQFRETMRSRFSIPENVPLLGLNIGCGTPDALWRRPNLELLREAIQKVQQATSSFLVLSGADFETDVNERFLEGYHLPALNLAGKTHILELAGLIKACRLFISSDSGPYHMGVALKVPTLGVFVKDFPYAYHNHPWVRNVVLQSHQDIEKFISSALELWKYPSE
jgi:ADP-heptose:LPS heptosyltransferase